MDNCSKCGGELIGELIYDTFFRQYQDEERALQTAAMYGATKTKGRWRHEIGIYSVGKDRCVGYRCPYCGHEWGRENFV